MTLEILQYPDSRLRRKAVPVDAVDAHVRRLADHLLETMYAAPGIGLAATQVGREERVFVLDISEEHDTPRVFINPEILERSGESETEEGCLSIPGVYEPVVRAARVRARALDREGEPFELEAEGLLAVCIQHELDHLDGKLFIDYLSPLKRSRIKKKFEKHKKQGTKPAPVSRRAV